MTFPSSTNQTVFSIKPLAIYWFVGVVVGSLYLRPDLTHWVTEWTLPHVLSVGAGLLATVVTTLAYAKVTFTGGRSLHVPTLFGFSIANGICETILFIASFKVGSAIAGPFTTQPLWLFLAGTLSFFIYSGLIHLFFWLKILPPHLNKSAEVKTARIVWIMGLVVMSLCWGWLYFAYQDVWSFVLLHVVFDAGMVYCIRYRLG